MKRRGTILIYTLGVLTLLALIGIGLLSTVRGERRRVELQRTSTARPGLMDDVIALVRQRLRADLWDDSTPPSQYLSDPGTTAPTDSRERNEPFDAPGPFDRWLSATLPHQPRNTAGILIQFQVNPTPPLENVLVWPRISYLGSDAVSSSLPFYWAKSSRTGAPFALPIYGETSGSFDSFKPFPRPDAPGVPIVLTPPAYAATLMPMTPPITTFIPGATTDVTIAEARGVWNREPPPVGNGNGPPAGVTARFPYFDTNMDGVLDLYDADGDGVPDSPISFVMPYPVQRPTDPREVYVAIRVVDNASMVNVNSASSYWKDGAVGAPNGQTFDESTTDLQRRGRRATEILFDPQTDLPASLSLSDLCRVADRALGGGNNNVSMLMNARSGADPLAYDAAIVRRKLIGGRFDGPPDYFPFGIGDEVSLRHRFSRAPYNGVFMGNATIDARLPNSLLETWRRYPIPSGAGVDAWFERLDSDYDESVVGVVRDRRPLFTAMSLSTERVPASTAPSAAPMVSGSAAVLVQAMPYGPGGTALPEPIDLNATVPEGDAAQRAEYLGWLAWAVRSAGNATDGIQVLRDPTDSLSSPSSQRSRLEAQVAANIVDYRDSDHAPTVVEFAGGAPPIAGLEAQPFINEAYAFLEARRVGISGTSTSGSRFAIELINPYLHPMNGFSLRVGLSGPLIPLNSIPAATAAGPGRLVVCSHTAADMNTTVVAAPPLVAVQENVNALSFADTAAGSLSFDPKPVYLLRGDTVVAGTPVPWVCDAFNVELDGGTTNDTWTRPAPIPPDPIDPSRAYNVCQREELVNMADPNSLNWRFTVATYYVSGDHGSGAEATLGSANNVSIPEIASSVWTFRDVGLTPAAGLRAFETPGELSRLLAAGNEFNVGVDLSKPSTVPEKLAYYQFKARTGSLPSGVGIEDAQRIAGRLDFRDLVTGTGKPRTGAIFNTVACGTVKFDGIDNDGDGATDENEEAAKVAFRRAGLINVNTAPADVLRGVPFMASNDAVDTSKRWDLAAAIVSLREKRRVRSIFGSGTEAADLSGAANAGEPFRTPADVLRATNADSRFDALRFGTPTGATLADHAGDASSPDFDRDGGRVFRAEEEIRGRDVFLARWANLLTTRSDVFTVYVALIDENGRYLRRSQFTIDRSACAAEDTAPRRPVLPAVIGRQDTDYYDDMR